MTVEDGDNPRPYPMELKPQSTDNSANYGEQTEKIISSYTTTYKLY